MVLLALPPADHLLIERDRGQFVPSRRRRMMANVRAERLLKIPAEPSPRAAYPRHCSSNATGLQGRNSARPLGIRASFQRDNLRRHFGVRISHAQPASLVSTTQHVNAAQNRTTPTALHYTFPTVRSFRGCLSSGSEDLETLGGVIEAIHEVEAALSEFKEKVIREGAPAQPGDAAAPAEEPADVIEPDCDGELVWCSSES